MSIYEYFSLDFVVVKFLIMKGKKIRFSRTFLSKLKVSANLVSLLECVSDSDYSLKPTELK